jgi:biotin transport system substrate-specific component
MRNVSIIILGSAFVAVCAHITLPVDYTPVQLTLQDFAVMALGLMLTPRLAAATMIAYLAEGAIGLPVFALGPTEVAGLPHILGPTGGYLMAYPAVVLVISYLWRTAERSFMGALVSTGAGNMILFTLGGAWLGLLTHVSPQAVLAEAVIPYLPGSAILIVLATVAGYEWYRMSPAPKRALPTIYR